MSGSLEGNKISTRHGQPGLNTYRAPKGAAERRRNLLNVSNKFGLDQAFLDRPKSGT